MSVVLVLYPLTDPSSLPSPPLYTLHGGGEVLNVIWWRLLSRFHTLMSLPFLFTTILSPTTWGGSVYGSLFLSGFPVSSVPTVILGLYL